MKVICDHWTLNTYVDANQGRTHTTFTEGVKTNTKMAFAANLTGIDYEQLKLFCSILNIPAPPDSYDTLHQQEIYAKVKAHIDDILEANRKEAYEKAIGYKADGTGLIAVKTDGTYQKRGDRKRGYTSKVAGW